MNVLMQLTGRLFAVVFLMIGLWASSQTNPALAEPMATSPQTCTVGVYITSLRDFKLAEKSFAADFWEWSICTSKNKDLNPLDSAEIIDATSFPSDYNVALEKQGLSKKFSFKKNEYWSQRKINGTFYHNWDVKSYPFDRHVLKIQLEEANLETSKFIYTPDLANSGYLQNINLGGSWNITGFHITEEEIPYNTTFGDPDLTLKQAKYSRLVVSISIKRNGIVSFLKLSAGLYAALTLSILALLIDNNSNDRLAVLVGTLFAALVNMQAVEGDLGTKETVTLIDSIHIVAIICIFIATIMSVYSQLLNEADKGKRARYLVRRVFCPILAISFVVFNVVVISYAAVVG